MPARQRDAGVITHGATTADHFAGHFRRQQMHRPAQNRNGHQWVTAHCIDVADGIGGGNTAEIVRVIDDRHKEIGGRNHPALVIQGIDRSIVTRGIADPQLGVEVLRAAAGKDHFQYLRRNLAPAPRTVAVLGQADRLAHKGTSGQFQSSRY